MADTDPDPPIRRADMGIEAADAVVAASTATTFHAQFARHKVDFVIKDDNIFERSFEEPDSFADRPAGLVHKGGRFHQQHLFPADSTVSSECLKPRPERTEAIA